MVTSFVILGARASHATLSSQVPSLDTWNCEPPKVAPAPDASASPSPSPSSTPSAPEEKNRFTKFIDEIEQKIDRTLLPPLDVDVYLGCKTQHRTNALTGVCFKSATCRDGSPSHTDPIVRGQYIYEGKCGQTAAANVITQFCQVPISPETADLFGDDLTPGWRPSTLRQSLDHLLRVTRAGFSAKLTQKRVLEPYPVACPAGTFHTFKSETPIEFLSALKKSVQIAPTPVLLYSGGISYHWVTLLKVDGFSRDTLNTRTNCKVLFNDSETQAIMGCAAFAEAARTSLGYVHIQFRAAETKPHHQ